MSKKQLQKLAYYYAIQDRELYIDSYRNCTDAESLKEVAETKKLIARFDKERKKLIESV